MTQPRPGEGEGSGVGAFRRHRALWLASNLRDRAHLAALTEGLERVLESGAATHDDVAAWALGICLLARAAGAHEEIPRIAYIGLDALDSWTESGPHAAEREALLAACAAERHAHDGRRLDALGTLRRARRVLEDVAEPSEAAVYAAMLVARLEGLLAELGRDRMGGARAFGECALHAQRLLAVDDAGARVLSGPLSGDVPERLAATVPADAVAGRVAGLLGRVRMLVPPIGGGPGTEAALSAARDAYAAIELHGVPHGIEALESAETFIALNPGDAARLGLRTLRHVHGQERLDQVDWEAVVYAARAHGAALRGDEEAAAELYERAGTAADEGASPEVAAFVRGLDLLDNGNAEPELRDAFASELLHALSELADAELGAAPKPDARAARLLAAPIGAAIAHVAASLPDEDEDGPDARVALGLLIDILREPRWQPVIPGLHTDPDEILAIAGQAWELALDRLGRLLRALRDRPDAAVLVLQRVDVATVFIGVRIGGMLLDSAGPDWRDAARALSARGAGAAEGRAAFEALPSSVRELLRSHGRVLIVPDPLAQEGAPTFQRMVDGGRQLADTRALDHTGSLREAMRLLEPEGDDVTALLDGFADPAVSPSERLHRFEKVRDSLEADDTNPRAAGALALALAMTRLDTALPEEALWAVERLIAAADELDHTPTGAILRAVRARQMLGRDDVDDARRLDTLEQALPWLERMRERGDAWTRIHNELTAERDRLALRTRPPTH